METSRSFQTVSVVVPVKNSSRTIEACLKSIRNQSYPHIELIVVDNKSTDSTRLIASKYADLVLKGGRERSSQRNLGLAKASGNYVVFIDSDMVLEPTVLSQGVALFEKQKKVQGLIIPETSFGIGFWAECKKLERSFYIGVKWLESSRFFRTKIIREIGGFNESNTGTEDYDIHQRLIGEKGVAAIARTKAFIHHDEGNLNITYTLKKKYYYAQKLQQYTKLKVNNDAFKTQANIFRRYTLFCSNPGKLFQNPLIGLGMMLMKTLEFIAGGLGFVSVRFLKTTS